MAEKNEKWVMFRNFMFNELEITKEDIQEWIKDAVKEQAEALVKQSYGNFEPEKIIKNIITETSYFYDDSFKNSIMTKTAEILASKLNISIK